MKGAAVGTWHRTRRSTVDKWVAKCIHCTIPNPTCCCCCCCCVVCMVTNGSCHVLSCSLSVRGLKSDSAVLCTRDESFEVKEAETSNSLLLLPHCQFTAQSLSGSAQPSAVNRQVHPCLCRFLSWHSCDTWQHLALWMPSVL